MEEAGGREVVEKKAKAKAKAPLELVAEPVELLLEEFREWKDFLANTINPANVSIPELTRLSMSLSFLSMALTCLDKGTDGASVVTSLLAGDLSTGLMTLIFMYFSGIATLCIWLAPGHILEVCARLSRTCRAVRYRLCCSLCGGKSTTKLFDCACVPLHRPLFWLLVTLSLLLAPFSTPLLFIVYFWRQVRLYRKCEKKVTISDEETTSFRVLTEVVSQAMIAECFFESAPQVLLQMYVLATQFGKIHSSQQRLRFFITIAVMISSMLELGITVGGRWVDNLVAHPAMELRPDMMKVLLYTEAISFLLVRSTIICGSILVMRALLGSGLQATLIVLAFLLVPRIMALILRIYFRLSTVRLGTGDYVGKLVSRVVGTVMFYPVLQYQWTLIYVESETVFLGLFCLFSYYGEYGVKAEIELFRGVGSWQGRLIIYFLSLLYILSSGLRWTRVIYLLRLRNALPDNSIFTVFKHAQSISHTMDEWAERKEAGEKKFRLRVLNHELGLLLRYFEQNFPTVVEEVRESEECVCSYAKCLQRLWINEQRRRQSSLSKFRPAEKTGQFQLGDLLLYAELLDLLLLRAHVFSVVGGEEDGEVCKGHKWNVYRELISNLLLVWEHVHTPRCPQQFLSRSPTFLFADFELLLNVRKASELFGDQGALPPLIWWNSALRTCPECDSVHVRRLEETVLSE